MPRIAALIPAAGQGRRMGKIEEVNKQYIPLHGVPALVRTIRTFLQHPLIDEIIVILREEELDYFQRDMATPYGLDDVRAVAGGKERQDSVACGLAALEVPPDLVLIHDGARPLVDREIIDRIIEVGLTKGAAVAGVPVKDTIKVVEEGLITATPRRDRLWAAQTPQAFRYDLLCQAYQEAKRQGILATDDASLVEALGHPVHMVMGSYRNLKLTTPDDVRIAEGLLGAGFLATGIGYDIHRLVKDRPLILGGLKIPYEKGLLGHSDADVLTHAVMDALLGAAALGDIGAHFPDTDPAYGGACSLELLEEVMALLRRRGARVINVDGVIMAQRPKLAPHIPAMEEKLAQILNLSRDRVNIKATTTEGLDAVGQGEAIAALVTALTAREEIDEN
ncbi:MAG: 2-C-methyl-D-erythritol 4-phosphate cytidylyltransferase [Limnochordia bacterium]